MNFLNDINSSTIIICSFNNKKLLLKELNKSKKLLPIKFMTLNEVYDKVFFTYNEETLYNVMTKYNLKYDIASMYLKNLIYVETANSNNEKIDKLLSIKAYLDSKNLLIYDNDFLNSIKNTNLIIYGFGFFDKFTDKVINILKGITNVTIINKEYNSYNHNVIEFNHVEEEVEFVASKICSLINSGVNINNIKITNIDDDYIKSIYRIFKQYNIPVELNNECYISSTLVGEYFINNYDSNLDNVIEAMKEKYNASVVNQIISIINSYTFESDKLKVKDMIIHDLANTRVRKAKLENSVKIIDLEDSISDEDYVFLMNFNEGSIPKAIKDEDFLTNKEKGLLNLNTNVELSIMIKNNIIKTISSIKNLIITYKLESYSRNFFKSNLISDMNLTVVHEKIDLSYSALANKIKLCKCLDKYYKYNMKSDELSILNSSYNIPYRSYNNTFKGISTNALDKLLKNKLTLSYSSLESYNECGFKYYINNVLKLDPYEDHFSAFIGSVFHYVLEKGIKENVNVSSTVSEYIKNNREGITSKERFFMEKLIPEIEFALSTIKDNLKYTKLLNIETENKYLINKSGRTSVTFIGFIDKMMSYNDGISTYVAVVDYKTYTKDINMKLLDYGLNIQLPIYLYLVNNKLSNVIITGFYVQKILASNTKYSEDISLINQKKKELKLEGYSNSNHDIIKLFDSSYKDSNVIYGLKLKNDGNFDSHSKVLSSDDMKIILDKTDKVIDKCINDIEECKFDINPKVYKDNNISCNYCKYKDLCYKTPKDEVEIIIEEGDNDA